MLWERFSSNSFAKGMWDLDCTTSTINTLTRLPDLLSEVERKVQRIKDELTKYPTKPTGDPVVTIYNMIATFKKDVEVLVKGRANAGKEGLIQNVRRSKEEFREEIFRQAPEFKPFERPAKSRKDELDLSSLVEDVAAGVKEEDLEPRGKRNPDRFVYLDDVLERARE